MSLPLLDLPPKLWLPERPAIVRHAPGIWLANFLPGWFPAGAAAAKAALTAIVQQASATSTAATITAPADIQAGDLLLILDLATHIGSPTSVTPTGFTTAAESLASGNQRMITSFKIADGSEASASITGMDGNLSDRKLMVTFRGNIPITSATPNTWGQQATTGNPTSQNVTSSGGAAPLIVFGAYGADNAIDPRTFSPAKDAELQGPATTMYMAWKIYTSSPSDHAIDMDDESGTFSNHLHSGYVACT